MRKPAHRYMEFLRSMFESTNDATVKDAARIFKAMYESGAFRPLAPPKDSLSQNAVYSWSNFFKQVPTALGTSGTSAPDAAPDRLAGTNSRATRDPNETAKEDWTLPDFANFRSPKQSISTKKLIERAQQNLPSPMMMSAPYCTMPMRCGYTITAPNNGNGVDVGYAGGSNGGEAAAGG